MAIVSKALTGTGVIFPDLNFGLYINGTDLNDTLYGTAYADEIHGLGGADIVHGGGGNDLLFGEAGNDSLSGGSGNDRLDGGSGNDALSGGSGADALIGGDGFDTVSYTSATSSVYVNLATNVGSYGDAEGDTFSSIEKIVGSNHVDVLVADDTGIVIDGGAGHDYLMGGAGLDVLIGGAGDDTLQGGRGIDILTGGAGADHFVFNRGDGPDLVNDFQSGVDKIVLGEGFSTIPQGVFGEDLELLTGTEVPTHLRPGSPFNRDALFYDTDDGQLYQISRGWSGGSSVEATLLATFANGVQLQASDFIL